MQHVEWLGDSDVAAYFSDITNWYLRWGINYGRTGLYPIELANPFTVCFSLEASHKKSFSPAHRT